jgi:hypothetical protein
MTTTTLNEAILLIRNSAAPFWVLSKKEMYDAKFTMVAKFQGGPDELGFEDLMEMSVSDLTSKVSLFLNPGTTFSMVAEKTAKTQDEARFGPIYFVHQNSTAQPQVGGLGSLESNNMIGQLMDKREALVMQQANSLAELNRKEMALLLDQKDFEYRQKAWEREKAEKERELKELKEIYESHSKRVENGLMMGLGKLVGTVLSDSKASAAIGGIANPPSSAMGSTRVNNSEPEPEETPLEKAIYGLGEMISERFTEVGQIQDLSKVVDYMATDSEFFQNVVSNVKGLQETVQLNPEIRTEG